MLSSSCLPRLLLLTAVLLLAAANHVAFAFRPATPPSLVVGLGRNTAAPAAAASAGRVARSTRSLRSALSMAAAESEILEADESVKRIRSPKVERTWVWNKGQEDEFVADGDFEFEIFLPSSKAKGVVFFMHGFSQYPVAYRGTLKYCAKEAGVAVVAVETGLTSPIVLKGVAEKPLSFLFDPDWPQFVLQRAVSEDTKQCIEMISSNNQGVFEQFNLPKNGPFGIAGHSMGGGLSFPVAVDCGSNYVFAMAPAAGVEEFDPVAAAKKGTIDHSMLLTGKCDWIARPQKVLDISVALNDARRTLSSVYVAITRGIHTGFEDKLVLFAVPITAVGFLLALILTFVSVLEVLIIAPILSFWRRNTGQLEGSQLLMAYFFDQMVKNRGVNPQDAQDFLDNAVTESWDKKFEMSFGGQEPVEND